MKKFFGRVGLAVIAMILPDECIMVFDTAEFASDCELGNAQSLQFHLNVGSEEANRIIVLQRSCNKSFELCCKAKERDAASYDSFKSF